MRYIFSIAFALSALLAGAQTNYFPLYSAGTYSGGSGDFTNISSPQLKLQATSGTYVRVAFLSTNSTVSGVFNFETGKYVYWGEPTDVGQYVFRGRTLNVEQGHLLVTNGNVGIGVSSPTDKLHINGNLRFSGSARKLIVGTEGSVQDYLLLQDVGSGSPALQWVQDGSPKLTIDGVTGNVGIGTSSPANKLSVSGGAITLDDDQPLRGGGRWLISGNQTAVTVGTANPGINLRFMSGADNPRVLVDAASGNVGIGTLSPNEKLTVNGTIYGKEVKVDLSVPGPDYVFNHDYRLPALSEIETFIASNGHLPEVPSATELQNNGIELGEMNMILLKKVEELTLHLIEKEKEISALESRVQLLENKRKH
jgi:hypothetical protein